MLGSKAFKYLRYLIRTMDMRSIVESVIAYNPVGKYVIRPTLRLVDAHNHPIRGGTAAAVASGLVHYALIEVIGQASDYFLGTNLRDPQTKMILTQMPLLLHFCILGNMFCNLRIGIAYSENKQQMH